MKHLNAYWFYYMIGLIWIVSTILLISGAFAPTIIEIGLAVACLFLVIPLIIVDIKRMHT